MTSYYGNDKRKKQRRRYLVVISAALTVFCVILSAVQILVNDQHTYQTIVGLGHGGQQYRHSDNHDDHDVCRVSKAMADHPLSIPTYWEDRPARIPNQHMDHVSSALCRLEATRQHQQEEEEHKQSQKNSRNKNNIHNNNNNNNRMVGSILAFKAARVGSTFFTKVITQTLKIVYGKDHTSMIWEPLSRPDCNGDQMNTTVLATTVHTLLTQACDHVSKKEKCQPDQYCHALTKEEAQRHVSVTAFNPRYFNVALDWRRVLTSDVRQPRLFTLRRTNLVLMAYSRFHHNGCLGRWSSQNFTNDFTIEALLTCAEHYALGDQELSSSFAYHAATAVAATAAAATTDTTPFLIVYEDVLAHGPLVQHGLLDYLGIQSNQVKSKNMFLEHATTTKKHVTKFCQYPDVDCAAYDKILRSEYPCLYQQMKRSDEGWAWTTPILSTTGAVDIRGDCQRMERLDPIQHPIRQLNELYSFSL